MLNRELEVTLNLAFKEARTKRHEFMTVEHLLLALLDNEAAASVLRACGANLDKLRHDLQEFIDSTTPLIPQHDEERETQPTLGFQRVLQRAVFHVQSSGKREVSNVLLPVLRAFVAPMFPEPISLISFFKNIFVSIKPKGIDPNKYELNATIKYSIIIT